MTFRSDAANMSEVTRVLQGVEAGDPQASDQLLVLLYDELRRLAVQKLSHEKPSLTLEATALVHEAYLRLRPPHASPSAEADVWQSRNHFLAAAAEAMRRILIERARQKASRKHGGAARRVPLDDARICAPEESAQLLDVDEALTALEQHDAQAAQLVKLRYFAGLRHQEAADALGISRRAADRLWALARAWLYRRLNPAK
jgi:RNA polymerase sigma factor (TIGR02999 family)